MKRLLAALTSFILLICSVLAFSGCGLFGGVDTDESASKKKMEQLLTSVKNGDKAEIKSLFAPNKIADIEDFDGDIDDLLAYYDGKFETFKGVSDTNDYKDHGLVTKHYNMSYDVTTAQTVYRFAVIWYVEDTGDKNNVGIWSLNVIKFADDHNQSMAYGGDGSWSNGIHLGEPYAFSYLDKLTYLVQNADRTGIKELFAKNRISDIESIDESIDGLISYFKGQNSGFYSNKEIKRFDDKNGGSEVCYYELSYDINTTTKDDLSTIAGRYRTCAKWCVKDTGDDGNVGIWSFYITEVDENFVAQSSYWGDGKWTDGIHIENV